MPNVLPCLTCLVPHVLSCPTYLVPYVPSCLTCLVPYVLLCPTCLVPYVLSCPTCSRVLYASCPTWSLALCFLCPMWPCASRFMGPLPLGTLLPVLLWSDNQYLSTIWYIWIIWNQIRKHIHKKLQIIFSEGEFKARYNNHKELFTPYWWNSSRPIKFIWNLKDYDKNFTIKWSIAETASL